MPGRELPNSLDFRVTAEFVIGPPTSAWQNLMQRLTLGMPEVGQEEGEPISGDTGGLPSHTQIKEGDEVKCDEILSNEARNNDAAQG